MTADVCVATAIALLIVIIAYSAWRRWRKTQVGAAYRYAAPASQELEKASDKLARALDGLVQLRADISKDGCPTEVCTSLDFVVAPAARVTATLKAAPLTYGGAYAVYKNLCDADAMYTRIADIYIAKGSSIRSEPLIAAGKQLYGISGFVHGLGVALNVE